MYWVGIRHCRYILQLKIRDTLQASKMCVFVFNGGKLCEGTLGIYQHEPCSNRVQKLRFRTKSSCMKLPEFDKMVSFDMFENKGLYWRRSNKKSISGKLNLSATKYTGNNELVHLFTNIVENILFFNSRHMSIFGAISLKTLKLIF